MSKFMSVTAALSRLAEDEGAATSDRVRALRMIEHPSLCLLRRLLHRSRKEPGRVPAKLLAVAALKYAREVAFRKGRPKRDKKKPDGEHANLLGI